MKVRTTGKIVSVLTLFFALQSIFSAKTQTTLQEQYLKALKSYEGAPYAPAGDQTGISCSTLIRKAFLDVQFSKTALDTIKTHPCLSEELKQGCYNQLTLITEANNLHNLDPSKLQPGDIAILGNMEGIHSLAYLGNKHWIHADQIKQKVTIFYEPAENSAWFGFRVTIMRWKELM